MRVAVACVLHLLFALLGIYFNLPPSKIAIVWLANAAGVMPLVRAPTRLLWWGVLALFVTNLVANLLSANPFLLSFIFALANGLEMVCLLFAARWALAGSSFLDGLVVAGRLILALALATVPSSLAIGLIGTFLLGTSFWPAVQVAYVGDALGAFLFLPLAAARPLGGDTRRWELPLLSFATVALSFAIASVSANPGILRPYMLFPLFFVGVLRTGLLGGAILLLAAFFTCMGAVLFNGALFFPVFAGVSLGKQAIYIQSFFIIASLTVVFLAGALEQSKAYFRSLLSSNQLLEKYAFLVSHDLQEPIRRLRLEAELLNSESELQQLSAPVRDRLVSLVGHAERAQRMIGGVLQLGRLNRAASNVEACEVYEVFSMVANRFREQGLEWQYGKPGEAVIRKFFALVERSHLEQVFSNLLSNSVKFCGGAAPRVTLTVEAKHQRLFFEYQDNGPGFADNLSEDIFKLFRRLNPKADPDGLGLGLPICRAVLALYGGSIEAMSSVGKGARFRFDLPSSAA